MNIFTARDKKIIRSAINQQVIALPATEIFAVKPTLLISERH
ncbi:Uncharacterised protein [Vibrio cholerae]|nr:Uncharacterised protein [Vibrio cholerae]CSI59365.1 Uncharacterised protein [Vibrio cholerae]